ncbi:EAL domain-containing protein [Deinococcus aquatilis]|uniref:EAL domain-containing protein n=1 Tax=Deinococcus aquatilis TaxID=519440 RepID=UPI0003800109|nr:EAL domain-containing protein [Deinococcus aquatilis]
MITVSTDPRASAQRLLASDPAQSLELAQQALAQPGPGGPGLLPELHLIAAEAAWRLGQRGMSAEHLEQVVPCAPLQARIHLLHAQHALQAGHLAEAALAAQSSVQAACTGRQHAEEGDALSLLAQIQHRSGEGAAALRTAVRLTELRRTLGDIDAWIRALCNKTVLLTSLGRLSEALTTLRGAQDLLPQCQQPGPSALMVYANLGLLHEQTGQFGEAYAQFLRAREVAGRTGNAYAEAAMGLNAGDMARQHGQLDEAATLLEGALSAARLLDDAGLQAAALHSLGLLQAARGQLTEAETTLGQAGEAAQRSGDLNTQLEVLLARAETRLRGESAQGAEPELRRALQLAQDTQRPREELRAHEMLAQLLEDPDPRQANHHLKHAARLCTLLRDASLAQQARDLTTEAELSGMRREIAHERALRLASEQAVTRALADVERERFYDALTGLPNRVLGYVLLTRAAAQTHGDRGGVSLAVLNLLRFKQVNDALGPSGGDDLLREVSARLMAAMKPGEVLARSTNDEFMLILLGQTEAEREARARHLLDTLQANFTVQGLSLHVQANLGLAHHPSDGQTSDQLHRAAHFALSEGRGQPHSVHRFSGHAGDRQAGLQFEALLATALERGEFELHYQPIIEAASGQVRSAEALLRWNSPDLGPQSPAQFIPAQAPTGMIIPVGAWALHEACRTAATWPDVRVAVNLSARQFQQGDLLGTVRSALRASGLAPERLELEITESLMIQSPTRVTETLLALRALGVHVMLDDFGTGYSSLSVLGSLPVSGLKIDRSFVSALERGQNAGAQAMIRSIVQLSQALGLDLVAEGVEYLEERELLRGLGVAHLQGFLFARPTAGWHPEP